MMAVLNFFCGSNDIIASDDDSIYSSAATDNPFKFSCTESDRTQDDSVFDCGKYSVFVAPMFFLKKGNLTNQKLQKLCYYAQAWCYALKGYKLADTDFQAWVIGPVSPPLWEKFGLFGFSPIRLSGEYNLRLDGEDVELLEDIWDTYGCLTGNALTALSQRELPWLEARTGYASNEKCTVVLSKDTMASYYRSIYCGE